MFRACALEAHGRGRESCNFQLSWFDKGAKEEAWLCGNNFSVLFCVEVKLWPKYFKVQSHQLTSCKNTLIGENLAPKIAILTVKALEIPKSYLTTETI